VTGETARARALEMRAGLLPTLAAQRRRVEGGAPGLGRSGERYCGIAWLRLRERNLEVHELVAVGAASFLDADSSEEEAGAVGGMVEAGGVEEEEALLGGVGRDGAGGEDGVLELVHILGGDAAVRSVFAGELDGAKL
jgi:hypothetical protein